MNLTDRERKILWTRAGNRCSFRQADQACDQPLSITQGDKEVVVGNECHIVGEKPGSARYVEDFSERESYSNAILLCPTHHKLIDDEKTRDDFPVSLLSAMKRDHEAEVAHRQQHTVIKDSEFVTEAKNVDKVIGMDIAAPTTLSNVKARVTAENVSEATGVRSNQPLTVRRSTCANCGGPISLVHFGPTPNSSPCPHCGHRPRSD